MSKTRTEDYYDRNPSDLIKPPYCRVNHADPGYCIEHDAHWPDGRYRCSAVPEFQLGDKVRVAASTLIDRRQLVYEVQVITPTQVRAVNGDSVLTLRKEKWRHV